MSIGRLDHTPLCPWCKTICNGWGALRDDESEPIAGDVTVCGKCSALLEFDNLLLLIEITEETILEIDFVDIQQLQQHVIEKRERDKLKNPLTKSLRTLFNNG